jgi:coproporphyrinogen III oxidase-like Fe-S oxidoreductase
MSPDAEISVEIDPRNLTAEHISALRDAGFNRASVGIQDFDETVQRAVNRIHDAKLVGSVLDWIREAGFKSLNLDSTHAGTDIHAFGVSSISQLPRAYAQHCKSLTDYHKEIDAGCLPVARGIALTEEDAARRHIIMRLMCDMGLDFDRMSTDLALDFEETFGRELQSIEPFEQDGLLTRYPGGVSVTRAGRLFIRNIAMEFDTWLEGRDARYSRTV